MAAMAWPTQSRVALRILPALWPESFGRIAINSQQISWQRAHHHRAVVWRMARLAACAQALRIELCSPVSPPSRNPGYNESLWNFKLSESLYGSHWQPAAPVTLHGRHWQALRRRADSDAGRRGQEHCSELFGSFRHVCVRRCLDLGGLGLRHYDQVRPGMIFCADWVERFLKLHDYGCTVTYVRNNEPWPYTKDEAQTVTNSE